MMRFLLNRMCAFSVLLCLSLFVFTSCFVQTRNNTNAAKSKIELEFWTFSLKPFEPMLQGMFAEYEALHPNVRIKWVDVPGPVLQKRALTAMLSPRVPDVINLNPDFSAVLATRHALLDMNKHVPESVRNTYLPAAWQACSLKSASGHDFAFGVPWYITSKITFYNRQRLREVGFEHPPETFGELMVVAKRLKEKTGTYAVMPNISVSGNFLKSLRRNGVRLYERSKEGALAASFGNSKGVELLQHWVTMYQKSWIPSEAITEGPQGAVDRYQSGSLALLIAGVNLGNKIQENAPSVFEQTNVAPQFPTASSSSDFSTMLLVVPKRSEHPKEAVDFALFMTNHLNQMKFIETASVPILPSVKTALRDPYFNQPDSKDVLKRGITISAQQLLKTSDAYQIRNQQHAINEIMDHYVQLAMLAKIEPEKALQKAQEEINNVLKENIHERSLN